MSKLNLSENGIEKMQRTFCNKYNAEYMAVSKESKIGYAVSTEGLLPINGLRHPAVGDTSGWYIWCGEKYSEAPDFFSPLHAKHIYEEHPQLTELLGLPPGYRFLLAGDYLDVWYDPQLLNI